MAVSASRKRMHQYGNPALMNDPLKPAARVWAEAVPAPTAANLSAVIPLPPRGLSLRRWLQLHKFRTFAGHWAPAPRMLEAAIALPIFGAVAKTRQETVR